MTSAQSSLKLKTAGTLKWNTIDRVATQVLYAVVGIVLANTLSKEDFGLVGALLIFQAFATIFVDSGFGAALLQKKQPTEEDYSTVFWFNLIISVVIYAILFFCAPAIADLFQGDRRLIPLSKVMFLTFVINGLGIVQANRMMKQMDVRHIAISNIVALTISGGAGVALALTGFGPWALVWQSVILASVKTIWLWGAGHWYPHTGIHTSSLKQIWRIGISVLSSSTLNTLCLNAYNFVIGAFYNLASLGVYTQADKWSKMGSASISQILTASFVPLLSKFQDSREDFIRYCRKINRFASFILFPMLIGLAVMGSAIFHTLFSNKWDAAIILFQILSVRGIFVVYLSLFGNYLLSLGYGKTLFKIELIKDVLIFAAIIATVFSRSLELLVWGQLAASALTYLIVMRLTSHATGYPIRTMMTDMLPYLLSAFAAAAAAWLISLLPTAPILTLCLQACAGLSVYIILLYATRNAELSDAINYLSKKI